MTARVNRRKQSKRRIQDGENESASIPAAKSHNSRGQEAPSAVPKGQRENSPGQRNAATAALGNRTPNLKPSSHGLPCRPGGSARQTMRRGEYPLFVPYPGRRSACPGLLSSAPSGLSICLATLATGRTFHRPSQIANISFSAQPTDWRMGVESTSGCIIRRTPSSLDCGSFLSLSLCTAEG